MLLDGLDGRDAKDVGANLNRVRLSVLKTWNGMCYSSSL